MTSEDLGEQNYCPRMMGLVVDVQLVSSSNEVPEAALLDTCHRQAVGYLDRHL